MDSIIINGCEISIKDYECISCEKGFIPINNEQYYLKGSKSLWLYANVTNNCNAKCRFCISKSSSDNCHLININSYENMLSSIYPYIKGVSFTGGEPLLFSDLLFDLIEISSKYLSPDIPINLATNGTNIEKIVNHTNFNRICDIHLSRHSYSDSINNNILGINALSKEQIKLLTDKLDDKCKIVLNCVLQKGAIDSINEISKYLDFCIECGIHNTSFITLMNANEYCNNNYVSLDDISELYFSNAINIGNGEFFIWNRYRDYDYCKCMSGSYINKNGKTRFYFRSSNNMCKPNYCRQLVFDNNILYAGFSGKQIAAY